MEKLICPICKNINEKLSQCSYKDPIWQGRGFFGNLIIRYCLNCGFGFSHPFLDEAEVKRFYEKFYRELGSPFYIDFKSMEIPTYEKGGVYEFFLDRALAQLTLARGFVVFSENDIFLDVGPGSGASYAVARQLFNNPLMAAIELSEGASEAYSRLYKTETFKSLKEIKRKGLNPKIILMSHSLEHHSISDLSNLFDDLKSILSPKGVLVIEVPYVDMRIHLMVRDEDSPHFLFFSHESLIRILEENNFEILFIDTCGDIYSAIEKSNQHKLLAKVRMLFRRLFIMKSKRRISANFCYGGNRKSLRAVVRLKK
jgi:hypothetical protein